LAIKILIWDKFLISVSIFVVLIQNYFLFFLKIRKLFTDKKEKLFMKPDVKCEKKKPCDFILFFWWTEAI